MKKLLSAIFFLLLINGAFAPWKWDTQGSFSDTISALGVSSNNKLFIGGGFLDGNGLSYADRLIIWNGDTNTYQLPDMFPDGLSGNPNSFLDFNNEMYICGTFQDVNFKTEIDKLAVMNTTTYTIRGINPFDHGHTCYSLATYGGDIYVGGALLDINGITDCNIITKFDGDTNTWKKIGGTGYTNKYPRAIIPYNGEIYVGGALTDFNGIAACDNLCVYNPTTDKWRSIGGLSSFVLSMHIYNPGDGNRLYVGGNFTDANGISTADKLAAFNLTTNKWETLGTSGLGNSITAITDFNGELYVGGYPSDINQIAACDNLCVWNGTNWRSIGGLNGVVNAFAKFQEKLYIGGAFTDANGISTADRLATYYFSSNTAPTLTSVDLNEYYARSGQTIKVSVTAPADAESDALSLYCATTSPASSGNTDFCSSVGNASPYTISCTGTGAAGDSNHTIYCKLYDGTEYSSEYTDQYQSDNTTPATTDNHASGWQTTNQTVTLTCTDTTSGCATTQYRVDLGAWQTGTSVAITTDANHQIDYNSTDNVGNMETTKTIWVALDKTAPVTTDDHNAGWQATDANVKLSCTDNNSGCSLTQYRINSGAWVNYDTNIFFNTDGNHRLDYNSKDTATNIETMKSAWITVDKTAPSVGATTLTGFTTYLTYIKGTGTIVGGTATDSNSGNDTTSCEYLATGSWAAGTWNTNHCEKTSYAITNGTSYTFNTRIKDNVANQGTGTVTSTYTGDTAGPTSPSITITDTSGYTNDSTPALTLSAADAGSGIKEMAFSCNNSTWSAWIAYATSYSSFDILTGAGCSAGDGTKTVYVKYRDNLDNESSAASDSTYYDTTAPTVYLTGCDINTWKKTNQTCTIQCSDAGSGCDVNKYNFDLNAFDGNTNNAWTSGNTFTVHADGNWTICFDANDHLNYHSDTNCQNFLIDKTPPTLTSDYNSAWHQTDFNLHITCSDVNTLADYSGCKTTFYKKDTSQNDDTNTWAAIAAYDYNIYWNTSGTWALDFNATDNADNNSTTTRLVIKIDQSSPTNTLPSPTAGTITESSTISIDVNDLYSGISTIAVTVNGITSTIFNQTTKCTASDINQISPINYHCTWEEILAEGSNTIVVSYNDLAGWNNSTTWTFDWKKTVSGGGGGSGPGGGGASPAPEKKCFEIVWPNTTDEKGFILLRDTMIRSTKKEEIIKIKNICDYKIKMKLEVSKELSNILFALEGQEKTIEPGATESLSVLVITDANTEIKTWEGTITAWQSTNTGQKITTKLTIASSPFDDMGFSNFKSVIAGLFAVPIGAGLNTCFYFGILGLIVGAIAINGKTDTSKMVGGIAIIIGIGVIYLFGWPF